MNIVLKNFRSKNTDVFYRMRSKISDEEFETLTDREKKHNIARLTINTLMLPFQFGVEFLESGCEPHACVPKDEITPQQGLELMEKYINEKLEESNETDEYEHYEND